MNTFKTNPYQTDIETLEKQLKTTIGTGLSSQEAKDRFKIYGPNTIKEEKLTSPIKVLLKQFLSPLMYILLIAAVASFLIGEIRDLIVIIIAVTINVVMGFMQEWKAEKAVAALKAYEVPECTVRRDGKIVVIKAQELVPLCDLDQLRAYQSC